MVDLELPFTDNGITLYGFPRRQEERQPALLLPRGKRPRRRPSAHRPPGLSRLRRKGGRPGERPHLPRPCVGRIARVRFARRPLVGGPEVRRLGRTGGAVAGSLAVRIVAQGAGAHFGPTAVRDDLRHLRVAVRKPVRGTEAVADLCQGELQVAAGKAFRAVVGSRLSAAAASTRWGRRGTRLRKAVRPCGRSIGRESGAQGQHGHERNNPNSCMAAHTVSNTLQHFRPWRRRGERRTRRTPSSTINGYFLPARRSEESGGRTRSLPVVWPIRRRAGID